MHVKKCRLIALSPCGGTMKALEALAGGFSFPVEKLDLTLPKSRTQKHALAADELAVFGFPVYGGHIPPLSKAVFAAVSGAGGPALLVAVYGNREYEAAFIDMDPLAREQGFVPFAAVAAVAEHTVDAKVAAGRPDAADRERLAAFGRALSQALADMKAPTPLVPPGFVPEARPSSGDVLLPTVDDAACTRCGVCSQICPAGAIPADRPDTTTANLCLFCVACVRKCPEHARNLAHPMVAKVREMLEAKCAARKEAELFPAGLGQ